MTKCEICEDKSTKFECFNCETEICEDCVINCSKFGYDFCCEDCRGCFTCDESDRCGQHIDRRIDTINYKLQELEKNKKELQEMRDKL
jgi:hypothetical protein